MHIIVVLLFWGMRPEELGTLKKKESDRIRSRLVRLVREKSDARKGEKKTSKKTKGSKKSGKIKWETGITEIQFTEKLPDISMVKLSSSDIKSDRHVPFSDKKGESIDIKKVSKTKGSEEEIKIKFQEDSGDLFDNEMDGMPKMIDDGIDATFNDDFVIVSDTGEEGKKGQGLPGGLSVDGVVGGGGRVVWSKKNKLPAYPEEAEKNGWEGVVKLRLTVDASGNVKRVFIEEKSGYSVLDNAAKSQARNWKIYIIEKGIKIKGTAIITIPFELK